MKAPHFFVSLVLSLPPLCLTMLDDAGAAVNTALFGGEKGTLANHMKAAPSSYHTR